MSYAARSGGRYHPPAMPPAPHHGTALLAVLTLACAACRTTAPPATEDDPDAARTSEHSPEVGAQGASPPTTATPAVDRTAELGDLEAMCAALDHDYIDGTLSDYYADVKPATTWGEEIKKAGDAADQPGRHLEGAAEALAKESGLELPAPCTKLFDVLDDLE